ncbi:ATP-binding cassette domain-containing protein [Streptococcus mutans]|uniref:iron ABC transporter ATP-binding protein n=1 Tax=Streptococcus mutans TaxID=1309 RepID=UPI0028E8E0B4|nr:ATP-binding cassette domain-containing protein [Streptococcus mutans]MDT9523241.1 ATP-binding cassette domain-containing protein [Streptococcus mutans]MDT9525947.1 ATP-binding cassette domain-containing protein [Streptococcus mutans]MDT9527685.1 ATP-binding cassette domain-containing protein [Streptococcus mutans]
MISVKNIIKHYQQKPVLNDLTVNIEKGKITAIIGSNGSGKSTFLSIMSRLIEGDSGQVLLDKKALKSFNNNDLAKRLAILRQTNYINLKIRVAELVAFGRFPHHQGRLTQNDQDKITQALAYMELEEIKDRFLDELSGGQLQRAFIAMILAQDTDYILLDEPLNNLDMKHSVQIMQILRRLVKDFNKTIILVIHDVNFASCYADNIVALKEGKIIANGNVDEVVKEEVLSKIYDMPIKIEIYQGRKICNYFDPQGQIHCETAHKLLSK